MFLTKNSKIIGLLAILIALVVLSAVYPTWKTKEDTKNPVISQIGLIDMNKAIKAHPKYQQLAVLEQQYNAIAAKAEAEAETRMNTTKQDYSSDMEAPDGYLEGIGKALEQEYKAKMSEKQAQFDVRLQDKAAKVHQDLSAELKAYSEELDNNYHPQIFSIQLKIKAVQLTKEEMAGLQSELERLQNERASKLADKQRELATRLDQIMTPEKAAAEHQLEAYSNQLNQELSAKADAKRAEIAARNQQSSPVSPPQSSENEQSDTQQQLAMKRQEIDALKQAILDDIRDKAGKVAVTGGIGTILANIKVNVSAVDITSAVISEFSTVQRPGLN